VFAGRTRPACQCLDHADLEQQKLCWPVKGYEVVLGLERVCFPSVRFITKLSAFVPCGFNVTSLVLIINRWRRDYEMGRQMLTGISPLDIELCTAIPDYCQVSDEHVNSLLPDGCSLESEMQVMKALQFVCLDFAFRYKMCRFGVATEKGGR